MIINNITGDHKERRKKIKEILPKQTLISEILEPLIEKTLFNALALCVRRELEIYRAFPKRENEEPIESQIETFNPTNNETCYMGKAFQHNGDLMDSDLAEYRKAIGTIPHYVWGNCTLLEIWGGDHFEKYPEMVKGAFEWAMGVREDCPEIVFHVNPLFKNKSSAEFKLSQR